MALRDRASGIMDYIGRIGADLITPPQASPVMQGRSPLQMTMNRPEVQFSQPSANAMVTTVPDGTFMAMASPTPQIRQEMTGAGVTGPRINPPQVVPARTDSRDLAAEARASSAQNQNQMRDMGGAGVLMTGPQLEQARMASRVVEEVQKNPQIQNDPSFMDGVRSYFGDRENMVRLAMAFNTMRLKPDQGLTAALGDELKDLRASRTTNKTQTEIVKWLQANGYGQYVGVAQQSPKAALEIFKQITQQEFAPGKSPSVSGVQFDENNRAYVVVSKDGVPTVQYIGTTRVDPIEADRLKGQWELSAKRSDEVSQKASSLELQLSQYQQAIQAIRSGAESGVIRNRLPAFDVQTATLRSIAQQLGIGVINSATFGALSEKELELALSTTMDLNLPPDQLERQIIEKAKATEKLYLEMRRKAAEMASMPYSEYIKLQNERTTENEKFRKLPEGVDESLWYGMTLDQKRAYYEAGQ